jgi:hypothetical protein
MDFINKNVKSNHPFLRSTLMVALLGIGAPLFASNPTSGQLVIINGLANIVNGSAGETASAIKVVVNDSTGPCSTTASVAYKGTVTVSWAASNTHSATSCTNITSVDVSALKTVTVVQYDSTANSTPPAVATAATNFVAPTTPITNLSLIVTGGASPATTGSATVWGAALGVKPVYDTNNGSLTTTGIMGGVGAAGLKAEAIMRRYAITPMASTDNWAEF